MGCSADRDQEGLVSKCESTPSMRGWLVKAQGLPQHKSKTGREG